MRNRSRVFSLLLLAPFLFGGSANAQPAGASVAIGTASINQTDAANTIVTQASEKALINWQSFSVAAGANVTFRQPDSAAITLNRVLGPGASSIDGSLFANGQVWLINPNGVLFGRGSTIDVGALLATTADIGDDDFLRANYDFKIASGNAGAAIVNQGSIRANSVVLAGPRVSNDGLIEADLGNVVLAGANTFALDFSGDNLLRFAIASPAAGEGKSALVANSGTISAPGGKVLLTARAARDVIDNVVNTSGMIEARSVSVQNGAIVLDAGDGTANVSGILDASGKSAGETGGAISVLGGGITIADGATLDASGDQGGGTILAGGNFHGAGPEQNAATLSVGKAVIRADALSQGNGGNVALWSNAATSFAGQISAKGGAGSGDGGFVETSGGTLTVAPSARVAASAANGAAGTWLLDPKFIIVASGGGGSLVGNDYGTNPGGTVTIDPATITAAMSAGTGVTLEANTDLTISNAISAATTPSILALHAGRSIFINADINIGSGTANVIANDPNANAAFRDAGAASIVAASGTKLTALAVNFTLSNGGAAGAIGSAATPVGLNVERVSVKTFGSDVYLNSPVQGLILGTTAGDIAAGTGNIKISAHGALSVDSAVAGSHVLLASGDNIVFSGAGAITASGSGDAIVLGVGNAFLNTVGSGALSLTGGGRWLIFSQDPGKTAGSGLTAAPFYNRTFDLANNSYDPVTSAGNRFVYAQTAVLTVTANNATRVYGAANPPFSATITGLINGDTLGAALSGTPALTTTATTGSPVGTYPIVPALGTLASDYNYGFSFAAGTLNVTTGVLTAGLTGTVSKIYNGNTAASLAAGNYTLAGLAPGDVVTLNNPASGAYDTKNAGTGKTVSVTGLALSGADAGNYALASTSVSGAVGVITKASLLASLTGSVTKIYNGTTAATLTAGNYVLSGVLLSESVSLNNPVSGTYDTKNAGTGKTVSVTGLALSGADAGNYVLASTSVSGAVGTITQAAAAASLTGSVTKVYNGTTAATLAPGNYVLAGILSGDGVALNNPASGAYDTKNAGTGKTVSVTGLALSGADAGNYALASTSVSGAIGTITQAAATASLTGSVTKVYNGTTAATLAPGNYALAGIFSGDGVALNNPASGTYDTKNAGTGKTVSVTGLALSGADAGNYALASTSVSGAVGVITQAAATASLTGSVTKIYNGTTAATLTAGNYVLSGVLLSESVSLNNPVSGTYDTKNAGTGKTVSVTGLALSGADAGNYALASTSVSGAVGTITQAAAAASLTGSVTKVYNGTTAATLAPGNYALAGIFSGDGVALNNPASGTYDTKNAGTGKTVSVSGLALSGADAGNYVLSSTSVSGAVGAITQAAATASLMGSVTKVYNGTTAATLAPGNYVLAGILSGDGVTLNNPASGAYDTKNAGAGKTVNVTGLALSGADAGNYALASTSVSGAIGTITQAAATASLTGSVTKVYNGTTAATLAPGNYALAGIFSGDGVALNNPASGTYDTKNAGAGKTVNVTGLALSGADAGNYALAATNVSGAVGVITKANLTAALTGTVSKVYDGTNAATLAPANYALGGVFGGDSVAVNNPAGGTYDTKNVGTGKTVSVSGLALSGADAGNYNLTSTSLAAAVGTVTRRPLTASLTGTVSKAYDGTSAAALSPGNYALGGVVGGDTVTLNDPVTGSFDSKAAGSGKTVSAAGLVLSGAGADNYSLASTVASGAIGTITPRTAVASLTGSVVKTYDGTAIAALAPGNYTLSGLLAGDAAALNNPASGTYDSKEAGSGKLVSVAGFALTGADAGNYILASSGASASIGVIAKATLTPGLIGTVSKIYDGTVSASLGAGNYALAGGFAGDSVGLNNPLSGTFDTPLVGTGKIVTVTGLALTGAAAGDYVLATTTATGAVGQINKVAVDPAMLTIFLPPPPPPVVPAAPAATPPVLITLADAGGPPQPLATLGGEGGTGNGGEAATSSDGVTQSVGQSLDGSRRTGNAPPTAALLGGMLNTLVPTLPTNTPHGVPPADQDFSSWGNEALWL